MHSGYQKQRKKIKKKYLKTKSTATKQIVIEAKATARDTLNETQKSAWQDFISKLTYKTNSETILNLVNCFRGKFFEFITFLKVDDNIITEDTEKAEALAQHYNSLAKDSNLDPTFRINKTIKKIEFEENLVNIQHDTENNLNKNFTLFE